jgi:hypothetical protein
MLPPVTASFDWDTLNLEESLEDPLGTSLTVHSFTDHVLRLETNLV